MKRLPWFLVAASLGAAGQAIAQSQLSLYNVITRGSLSTTSDIEGKVVAYSLGSSSATFAQKLSQSSPSDINVSVVLPLVGNPINVSYGSMYSPYNIFGRTVNFGQNGASLQTSGATDFNAIFNGITSESSTYSGYAATGSLSWNSQQNIETLKVSGLRAGTAVFNLTGADLNHANEALSLNLNGYNPQAIIINVDASAFSGNSSDYWGLNQFQSLASKVVWNFYNAGSVALNTSWYGSILAPGANLTANGTITGSVGVNNFSTQGEVHLAPWVGVPEASTVVVLNFAAGCLFWSAVRRRPARPGVPAAT